MKQNRIPGTEVELSELGFGAAVIGNLYRAITDAEATAAVDAAWDGGIRYFDTAPHYGVGLSESRLGAALAGRPRDEYVVSTKVGRLLVPNEQPTGTDPHGFAVSDHLRREWDFSRDGVLRSLESSLARLGTDRVDLVYLHDPEERPEQALTEAAATLTELRDQGVIGAWGVGINTCELATRFVRETGIDVVMMAGRYTLLVQDAAAEFLPACIDTGTAVVNVGVFNSGLLSKPRPEPGAKFNYLDAPPELIAKTLAIADVCEAHGVTLPQVALAFGYRHPAIVSVALGMRTPEQVHSNLAMLAATVPDELWTALIAAGLLPGS